MPHDDDSADSNRIDLPALDEQGIALLFQRDLEAIRQKVLEGRPLTNVEWQRMEQARREGDLGPGTLAPVRAMEMEVVAEYAKNQAELGLKLGNFDRKTIQRWSTEPGHPGKEGLRYNVTAWRLWCYDTGKLKRPADKAKKEDLEVEILVKRTQMMDLDLFERRGQLVDLDEACGVFGDMAVAFAKELKSLETQDSNNLAGLAPDEVARRLRRRCQDILEKLSVPSWAKKKVFWQRVSETACVLLESAKSGVGWSSTS